MNSDVNSKHGTDSAHLDHLVQVYGLQHCNGKKADVAQSLGELNLPVADICQLMLFQ